jgi:hypothetical protein
MSQWLLMAVGSCFLAFWLFLGFLCVGLAGRGKKHFIGLKLFAQNILKALISHHHPPSITHHNIINHPTLTHQPSNRHYYTNQYPTAHYNAGILQHVFSIVSDSDHITGCVRKPVLCLSATLSIHVHSFSADKEIPY